ncbi:hypothetical protein JAAARDRAFT_174260 [Jaapia argillacea MUCL 33604]|uniref:CHAT domain-containing protein n=1 Tax=Jaapia argillacea MUCL 33604 TaxID=933084 RepID=A0A067Q246_9AGAM|nr:hypothetical protein JAAARDRAFT_174260 [Jaapia argillacea MUCL 33604]
MASTIDDHSADDHTCSLACFDAAVSECRSDLSEHPDASPERALLLKALAFSLRRRFGQSQQLVDLDEAADLCRQSLTMLPSDHPFCPSLLSQWGFTLHARFHHSRNGIDINEALVHHREALELLPDGHPQQLVVLQNIVDTLVCEHRPPLEAFELDEAVALSRTIVELSPSNKDSHHHLGQLLLRRFQDSRQQKDFDEAVGVHRTLEILCLDDSEGFDILNTVAATLSDIFDNTGEHDTRDLDNAIILLQEAMESLLPTDPDRDDAAHELATALSSRFHYSGNDSFLDEAIQLQEGILSATPHPPGLRSKFRFFAAQEWAEFADANGHESALEAYGIAIGFLPRIAMLGLDLSSRQHVLTAVVDGVARDATACAIREGNFERAVEFIEEGRAIFWSQALQLRAPLDHLRSEAPELVEQLQVISNRLEQESLRGVSKAAPMPHDAARAVEEQSRELLRLNDQWLACLEKVRTIKGCESFLLPKKYSDLRLAAVHGPVVILNATKSRRDALILRTPETDVLHVPLVLLTRDAEQQLVKMRSLLSGAYPRSRGDRGMRFKVPAVDPETIIKRGLAILWTTVVEPIIQALDLKKSASPPRIWWCPSGSFNSFPIHAAGIYDHCEGQCVSDYVISSYIPTLTTLLGRSPPNVDSFKMLIVIQPHSKNHEPIPYATEELRRIEKIVDNDVLVRYGIQDAPALVSDVLSAIPTATILHFACHGVQVSAEPARQGYQAVKSNPLNSALVLEDGPLKLTEIMELSLKNKSLVFLSACQTAAGDETLPDESMHLSATMLFAGFQGVVGTLWSIDDRDGPEVAEAFYRHLFSSSQPSQGSQVVPNTAEAARALHLAVRKLREKEPSFMRWVPFIHLGF